MTVETATYIDDLNDSNPASGDNLSEGDNHIRLLKTVLQNTFSGITGEVTATQAELNDVGDLRTDLTTAEGNIDTLADGGTGSTYNEKLDKQNVIAGTVDVSGPSWSGTSGVTPSKNGTGDYTLTLPAPFDDNTNWAICVQGKYSSGGRIFRVASVANGSVDIEIINAAVTSNVDEDFFVIAHYHG